MARVGKIRIDTPYMTVYLVPSLPEVPYTPYIYGLADPKNGIHKSYITDLFCL